MNHNATVRRTATKGNLGLIAAGQDAYLGKGMWAVTGGGIMLYDVKTNQTIDAAGIATASQPQLVVGQGEAGRPAKNVQVVGTKYWKPCIDQLRVDFTRPRCEVSQETAIAIGCVECDTSYPIALHVSSPELKQWYGGTGEIEIHTSYGTSCKDGCSGDCSQTDPATSYEVACGLHRQFKEMVGTIEVCGFHEFNNAEMNYLPFITVPLESGKKIYKGCLVVGDSTCDECNEIDEITVFSIVDVAGATQTLDLSRYAVGGKISLKDLDAVQDEINDFLDDYNGGCIIDGGNGCCSVTIKLAGCIDGVTITTTAGAVTICEEDPFLNTIDIDENACKACDTTAATPLTPSCLLLVWMKSERQRCSCGLPSDAINYANTRAQIKDVQFLGTSWEQGYHAWWITREYQPQIGSGYQLMLDLAERNNPAEGTYRYHGGGKKRGQFQNTVAKNHERYNHYENYGCGVYCSVNMLFKRTEGSWYANNIDKNNTESFTLDIPFRDSVTHADVLAVLNALVATGSCNMIGESCYTEYGAAYPSGTPCDCLNPSPAPAP